MLIEELFSRGIMIMGPSRTDPQRKVGVFNPDFVSRLPEMRRAQMETFRFLAGDWVGENKVPATSKNPAYTDASQAAFRYCEKNSWICSVTRDGKEKPHITYDPFSKQWMYVLTEGAYGILRSSGWNGNEIIFTGLMTMIGVQCDWRLTWTKVSNDEFSLLNEEQLANGHRAHIDEWRYHRK